MGTPFIAFTGPTNLDGYNRKLSSSEQPGSIPKTFLDAMEVREEVFVQEQGVPPENEFDADDARACHWVCCDCSFSNIAGTDGRPGHLCLDQYHHSTRKS
jgi:hypothetical protein